MISAINDTPQPSTSRLQAHSSGVKMRIKCTPKRKPTPFSPRKMFKHLSSSAPSNSTTDTDRNTEDNEPRPGTSGKGLFRCFICGN